MTTDTAVVQTASHVRTISRLLAHRCAVSEVFVTSLHARSPEEFVVGAQLPRMHAYYGDHLEPLAGRHDPLLVMEAARQAAIALTHEYFGVPKDMAFVVREFNGTAADTAAWEIGRAPADLVMTVTIPRRHLRQNAVCGLDMVLDIECAGTPMMTVDGSFFWITGRQWGRLRTEFRESLGLGTFHDVPPHAERAPAATVGRENRRNVVIAPIRRAGATATAELVADTAHPFLFDHPLDHVPGSLLIEAARQTAVAMLLPATPRLLRVASSFDRFVELDHTAECRAELVESAPPRIRCDILQCGAAAARLELEFATTEEKL
ncbi:ScbA/BarX family gamma-butyrolactone biosynthesis protein [Nocardia blacklockiae]|uniref:ScbA/BarX family gamma-butyrolactone biosynthesis protein n=1 Tax=Nocardia blacklockiae TaxID=480036 RepID=UPI0018948EB2|nr:ScbA/BarX family gamma-butyrolactone biosynthesis protein [Nocardia blacklockiae]MBF6172170.1 gamma-butyrolactone biosynthesis protein [Nocardia blacklockiae]